ncbi:MAG: hypothetical protein AB9828_10185 [Sphaerochaetaceae bacterium]
MKHVGPIIIISIMILIFAIGCNSDVSQGIFRQITQSEKKAADIGKVVLLTKSGDYLYCLTSNAGLQKYDTVNDTWTPLGRPSGDSNPIMKASYSSVNDCIYFTTRTDDTVASNLYALDLSTDVITAVSNTLKIYEMDAQELYFTARSSAAASDLNLYTLDVSDSPVSKLDLIGLDFVVYPHIMVQTENPVSILISGYDSDGANHHYVTSSDVGAEITGITSSEIVAFHVFDGTPDVLVAVTADGKVWRGMYNALTYTMAEVDSDISLTFELNGIEGKPIPCFFDGTDLVIQGSSVFYSIDSTGAVDADSIDDLYGQNLVGTSFKITSYILDGTVLYGGTTENGLFKVDDIAAETVTWL